MYLVLVAAFFITITIFSALLACYLLKPNLWKTHRSGIQLLCVVWFVPYLVFVLFFTGPIDLRGYPPQQLSPFKLPWRQNVTRFVSQGNRSFTSHRALHFHAWDFVMASGTEVLAARDGKVIKVEVRWDGIGLKSNYLTIEHDDGTRAVYAHIRHLGAVASLGITVEQGL